MADAGDVEGAHACRLRQVVEFIRMTTRIRAAFLQAIFILAASVTCSANQIGTLRQEAIFRWPMPAILKVR